MKKRNNEAYSNGLCKQCNSCIENLEHMLKCQYRQKIWALIEKIISDTLNKSIKLNRLEILAGYFTHDVDTSSGMIINFLLCMTRWSIWLNRNSIRNDQVTISFEESYIRLKYLLLNHIKTLLLSKNTKPIMRNLLSKLSTSIETVLKNGLREIDI